MLYLGGGGAKIEWDNYQKAGIVPAILGWLATMQTAVYV